MSYPLSVLDSFPPSLFLLSLSHIDIQQLFLFSLSSVIILFLDEDDFFLIWEQASVEQNLVTFINPTNDQQSLQMIPLLIAVTFY